MILNFLKQRQELEQQIKIIDEMIEYILSKTDLTARERLILELRFNQKKALFEIGNDMGITRERVRAIESKALRKMANCNAWNHKKIQKMITDLDLFNKENKE